MNSILDHVAAARERLERAGVAADEAWLDARLLAQRALGWDTAMFLARAHEPAPAGFAARYEGVIARREAREPVAYITGERDFWNRTFEVSPAVLVPRPETEILVEAALGWLEARQPGGHANPTPCAADIGTGSGCLAVTLACERPGLRVAATDISEAALAVARRNAERYGVAGAISFRHADLLGEDDGVFDVIVSNPPYVSETDRPSLAPEVREFEPHEALFAGTEGLGAIRRIIALAPRRLAPGGVLMFEIGAGQGAVVRRLISATAGLTMSGMRRDLQGIERVAIANRT